MTVKVVILVHGMGAHGPTWADDAKKVIRNAGLSYGHGSEFSDTLEDGKVALMPIIYDDIIAKRISAWGNDSRAMAREIESNAIPVPMDITAWLKNADATDNNFIWTHVVDVILYRFFPLVTTDIQVHVMERIAEIWKDAKAMDSNAQVSVMAHSLGTSVVHDALSALGTNPPPNCTGFLAGAEKLASVFMVANVGKLLETTTHVYDSIVCPSSVRVNAYCGTYFNVRHALDPFPAVDAFRPSWAAADFLQIDTTAVREFNTHSFERYLEDPRVHIPFFRTLFGFSTISNETMHHAVTTYDTTPGPACPQVLKDFIADCRQRVNLIKNATDIFTMVTNGVQFLREVEDMRAKCKNTSGGSVA